MSLVVWGPVIIEQGCDHDISAVNCRGAISSDSSVPLPGGKIYLTEALLDDSLRVVPLPAAFAMSEATASRRHCQQDAD